MGPQHHTAAVYMHTSGCKFAVMRSERNEKHIDTTKNKEQRSIPTRTHRHTQRCTLPTSTPCYNTYGGKPKGW